MSSRATSGLAALRGRRHLVAPADLGDDLDVVLEREQRGERLADHRLVLGDQDPDGVHFATVAPSARSPRLPPPPPRRPRPASAVGGGGAPRRSAASGAASAGTVAIRRKPGDPGGPQLQPAADRGQPLRHAAQPGAGRLGARRLSARRLAADAPAVRRRGPRRVSVPPRRARRDVAVPRAGVADHVGDRLAQAPGQRRLGVGVERAGQQRELRVVVRVIPADSSAARAVMISTASVGRR